MISSVTLFRSCVVVVSKSITKSVITKSFVRVLRSRETERFYSQFSTMRPQIYCTRSDFPAAGIDLLQNECDIDGWNEASVVPRDELLKKVVGKDALFCTLTDKIDAEVIECAGPNLKVIATMSVGYEHIDLNECKKRKIRVGYTPEVLTDAVADLTIALLLATTRRLIEANKQVHSGGWKSWEPLYMCGPAIKNTTVGIVGFGRIAQEVAKRLIPFKPKRIIYSNKSNSREKEAREIGAERVDVNDLLRTSDIVILLCALTPETTHFINAQTLNTMKKTAVLINCARGQVIDQNALYDALRTNKIRAAGLDVTTPEPLPLDSPLLTLNNCVIIPHIGSAEIETRQEMCRITALNVLGALKNIEMIYEL
ncbi:glyoxylate reductase/hydroxypyruvate reductase [Contarinia nasturtii]|uniref:glyoxylate reductase/hydroxypyruvate reductase n=1 Tax=Contarinia nasturtii TaxID=265458 RepID=UPI0012D43C5E|nr:glyoxylate reductase/hydroxypyruvate reductase [Contarinia nasturtii]